MTRDLVGRWALGLIALLMLPAGIHAAFAPRSWYDEFPFGRGWIAAEGGSYDEHLARDIGVLFLALIVVTVWAVWRNDAISAIALAWLLQGVLHLVYHVGHLDGLGTADKVGLVGSLVTVPLLAATALFAGLPNPGGSHE